MNYINWPRCQIRNVDRPYKSLYRRDIIYYLVYVKLLVGLIHLPIVYAHTTTTSRYTFAIVSGVIDSVANEAVAQRLLKTIGLNQNLAFIVYDGNLKSANEVCSDTLYERRHALLKTTRPTLFFVPGEHDWASCNTVQAGKFDPIERLDLLRQTLFIDTAFMRQNPLRLTRESEMSHFQLYRENMRWQIENTIFIGLNLPGGNNHYLTAGGRNAEFEDRTIANAFWLQHTAEYAKRHGTRAIVLLFQGNPMPLGHKRPNHFTWLRFVRHKKRDGYIEFKQSLIKLAETFPGPVLMIHADINKLTRGFLIDQPLRNNKGMRVKNLTRIAFAPPNKLTQWIQVDVDMTQKPSFLISLHEVSKHVLLR